LCNKNDKWSEKNEFESKCRLFKNMLNLNMGFSAIFTPIILNEFGFKTS